MTTPSSQQRPLRRNDGFTMVVIAALFIAFAAVAAAVVERNTATQFILRRDATAQQLRRLNNALIEYAVFNGSGGNLVYPCPASPTTLTSASNFGISLNNGASPAVDDCSTAAHVADGMTIPNTDVVVGMVPVQSLSQYGIGLNDAFDPWNNRIMYVVNRQLTAGGTQVRTNNPTITEFNTITAVPISTPDFVLISYGRDGLGAYKRGRIVVDIACPVTGTYYHYNCDATATNFYDGPTYTMSGASNTTYFDDILSYHSH